MNLELLKADIEAVASKVLSRPVKADQDMVTDQEGEPVGGLIVDGFLLVYPVKLLGFAITGNPVEIEEVAIDILVGGDGQFEEPDPMRYPFEGHTFKSMSLIVAEVIGLIAKSDAGGHLESLGDERYLTERNEAAKALTKKDPLRVSRDRCVSSIQFMCDAVCEHCGETLPKGTKGLWLRTLGGSGVGVGGLFHTDCLEVADA